MPMLTMLSSDAIGGCTVQLVDFWPVCRTYNSCEGKMCPQKTKNETFTAAFLQPYTVDAALNLLAAMMRRKTLHDSDAGQEHQVQPDIEPESEMGYHNNLGDRLLSGVAEDVSRSFTYRKRQACSAGQLITACQVPGSV